MVNPPSTPAPPPPWPPTGAPRPARRWSTIGWLVALSLVAGVAIVGWLRPAQDHKQPAAPAYTNEQVANAKTNVCAAFQQVDHALALAYARNGGSDPTAQLAVATSTQLALDAGSRYLSTMLAEEPATPPDLATAVRKQTTAYQKALMGFLNGLTVSDPSQRPTVSASDEATTTIRQLCK
jgi:hypothetical protein